MKVLAVYPKFPGKMNVYLKLPSIELCIQSSILKNNGIDMDLFDMRINNYDENDFTEFIKKNSYDYIYFEDSPETHWITKKMIDISKKINNDLKIVIHGELSTLEPRMILDRNKNLDYIVRYDDDYSFLNIIKFNNDLKELHNIYNIAFRDKFGNIIVTEVVHNYYDINKLPMPNRMLFELDKYLANDTETIVRSSRGCLGNCKFCIKTAVCKFKSFSMKRFCDEIEYLQKMGFKTFFFSDDIFAYSLNRLKEFEIELDRRNCKVKWTSNLRIVDINDEVIELMKKLGAYRIFIGIETINSKSSKKINKNIDIKKIKEKLDIVKKYGLEMHLSFIIGCPGDEVEDLKKTIEFVKEVNPNLVTFNTIKLYPGLDIYKYPEKYGILLKNPYWFESDDWERFVQNGTDKLTPDIIQEYSFKMLMDFFYEK